MDRLGHVLERLYAAAFDWNRWPDALLAIEDFTESAGTAINLIPKTSSDPALLLTGLKLDCRFGRDEMEEYARDVLPYCPRLAAGTENPQLTYLVDYMVISEAQKDRDLAYRWYRRHDLRYHIGAPLLATEHHLVMWSLQRSPDQGHAQRKDIELFELLKPHLALAVQLADRIGTLTAHHRFQVEALATLPQAMFYLSSSGRILFANAAGEQLLIQGDGLTVDSGPLRTRKHVEQTIVDRLIAQAISPGPEGSGGWARLERMSGQLPYTIFIAPLPGEDTLLANCQARVLAIVYDPMTRRGPSTEMLVSAYGLTPSEARLAHALACGHNLTSASAVLGTTVATARTHLKPIFKKMGVNRQSELVRLLCGFPRTEHVIKSLQ